MGDIVVYETDLVRFERLWVPDREVRYWLRFWRTQGRYAWTLKQWRRNGQRPLPRYRPVPKTVGHLDHLIGISGRGSVT